MNHKSIFLIGALLILFMTAQVFAAGTPAGTVIENFARGGYSDANGNVIADVDGSPIYSDTVQTTVTQVYGVEVLSAQSQDIRRNGTVTYAMTLENTGNGTDSYTIGESTSSTGSSTFNVTYYVDDDRDGVLDAGETTTTTSVSNLQADSIYYFIAEVSVVDGAQGEVATTTVTGTSAGDGTNNAKDLTTTVQAALLDPELDPDATSKAPNDVITYTLLLINPANANGDTAYNVTPTFNLPSDCDWVGNVTVDGGGIADPGSGGTYNVGSIAPDDTVIVTYQVRVTAGTAENTTIDNTVSTAYQDQTNDAYTAVDAVADNNTGGRVTVSESNSFTTFINPDSLTGDPGDVVRFLVSARNTGNGSDTFTLTNPTSSQSWTWSFYVDDGNWSWDGTESSGAAVTVAAGDTGAVWAVATIPAGTADATVDDSDFRFTSTDNSATSDETGVTTVTAPVLTLDKTVNGGNSNNAAPGATLTYRVTVYNNGTGNATSVMIKDAIPANTTYVSSSMTIGGSGVTDSAADGDGSSCDGTTAIFNVGTVNAGANEYVEFQVTVD